MKFRLAQIVIFIATVAVVTSCKSALSFTPERAVIQHLLLSDVTSDIKVDTDSIRVLQKQPWNEYVLVFIKLRGEQENGHMITCEYMYETRRASQGWEVGAGGGGCGKGWPMSISITPGSESGLSNAYGLVNREEINFIEVLWDDQEIQHIPVTNDSYLAVREGIHNVIRIQAMDGDGQVIYTFDNE